MLGVSALSGLRSASIHIGPASTAVALLKLLPFAGPRGLIPLPRCVKGLQHATCRAEPVTPRTEC